MAAALALGVHMDSKKRGLSVFLDVEAHQKFLKMASNTELQKELQCEVNTLDIYKEQFEKLHRDFLRQERANTHLGYENESLKRQLACLRSNRDKRDNPSRLPAAS